MKEKCKNLKMKESEFPNIYFLFFPPPFTVFCVAALEINDL